MIIHIIILDINIYTNEAPILMGRSSSRGSASTLIRISPRQSGCSNFWTRPTRNMISNLILCFLWVQIRYLIILLWGCRSRWIHLLWRLGWVWRGVWGLSPWRPNRWLLLVFLGICDRIELILRGLKCHSNRLSRRIIWSIFVYCVTWRNESLRTLREAKRNSLLNCVMRQARRARRTVL